MSIATLVNRPCVLLYRTEDGGEDAYGNEIPTVSRVEAVCEIQQDRREERGNAGEVSDTRWTGYFLPGVELRTADAVEVEGIGTFELVGDPWPARNPRTQAEQHVEASLRLVRGAEEAS